MWNPKITAGQWQAAGLVLCAIVLAAVTLHAQVMAMGPGHLEGRQLLLHNNLMRHVAGDPWQHRVLPAYASEGLIRLARSAGLKHPASAAFVTLRYGQNMAIFVLAGYGTGGWGCVRWYRSRGCRWWPGPCSRRHTAATPSSARTAT